MIRNVHVENIRALGTKNGVRIKSAKVRGGGVENVVLKGLEMEGVDYPLHFELNWYPSYSYPALPTDVDPDKIPAHWKVMTTRVEPPERGIPVVRNIEISDVRATGAKRAIHANAYPEKPMRGIRLKNLMVEAQTAGRISNAADWSFEDVRFKLVEDKPVELKNCDGVHPPKPEPLGVEVWERGRQRVGEADKDAVQLGVGVDSKDE